MSLQTGNWIMGTEVKSTASNVKPPVKRIINLNDSWMFVPDPDGGLTPEAIGSVKEAKKAKAGLPWEAQFPDLVDYDGTAWYWRSFRVPEGLRGKRYPKVRYS